MHLVYTLWGNSIKTLVVPLYYLFVTVKIDTITEVQKVVVVEFLLIFY